jgi:hypothetical protein
MNEIPLIIQKRLVSVWIHDNGGTAERIRKLQRNLHKMETIKKKGLIGSVLRVRRPGRPHKYADGGALVKESGL